MRRGDGVCHGGVVDVGEQCARTEDNRPGMYAIGADQTRAASRQFLIRSVNVRVDTYVTIRVSVHDRNITAGGCACVAHINHAVTQVEVRSVVDLIGAVQSDLREHRSWYGENE